MKKLGLLFLFIGLVLISCNKNAGEQHFTINKDLLTAFNYKKGSYWVYKDSLTGAIDSFYVSTTTGIIGNNDGDQIEDYVNINLVDSNILPGGNKPINIYEGIDANNLIIFQLSLQFFIGGYAYVNADQAVLRYPFAEGETGAPYDFAIVTNIYNTYIINGNSFAMVSEIYHRSEAMFSAQAYFDWFYINADVGIVKMRLNHPSDTVTRIWELQRWHIVK